METPKSIEPEEVTEICPLCMMAIKGSPEFVGDTMQAHYESTHQFDDDCFWDDSGSENRDFEPTEQELVLQEMREDEEKEKRAK